MFAVIASAIQGQNLGRALGLVVACGSLACSEDSGTNGEPSRDSGTTVSCEEGEAYVPGMSKTGANGVAVTLVSSEPASLAIGDHTWQVSVSEPGGAAADGASISLQPWMPAHNHGTPSPAVIARGNGAYELAPVLFIMSGTWDLTFKVTTAVGVSDSVLFTLCIEE